MEIVPFQHGGRGGVKRYRQFVGWEMRHRVTQETVGVIEEVRRVSC